MGFALVVYWKIFWKTSDHKGIFGKRLITKGFYSMRMHNFCEHITPEKSKYNGADGDSNRRRGTLIRWNGAHTPIHTMQQRLHTVETSENTYSFRKY